MKSLLLGFVMVLVALFVLIYIFQRHLIFYPDKQVPLRHAFHAEDMQDVTLQTDDGLSLQAWYKPSTHARHPTLLILHGNAGNMGSRMPLARPFLDKGYGVLLLEYRGYGGNKGQPTEQGLYTDARAGMRFLEQQGVGFNQIVLYGESLGTGVATQMAYEHPVCALILQSPFVSLTAVGRYQYPWIVIPPKDKFDSFSRMKAIHVPVLMLHGTADTVVPYAQGRALFNQSNGPKQWVELPNKGHSDLWDPEFIHNVDHFIATRCGIVKR